MFQNLKFPCPPTPFETDLTAVPTSRTAIANASNSTGGKAFQLYFINPTAADILITVDDTPTNKLLGAARVNANDVLVVALPFGQNFTGQLFWQASGAGLIGSVSGFKNF
jgi:hypothetical protein